MNMLPTLNMAGWSILDYELAYDGIRQLNDATMCICNQPRAERGHNLVPGAAFIASVGEEWCNVVLTELIDSLRSIRFDEPGEDERRILLLLNYETSWGSSAEPLATILATVMAPPAKAA